QDSIFSSRFMWLSIAQVNAVASPTELILRCTDGSWETPGPALPEERAPARGCCRARRPPPTAGGRRGAGNDPSGRQSAASARLLLCPFPLHPVATASGWARASG